MTPSWVEMCASRACVGELVQIDGSEHAWFEDRGPGCTLLVYVDDATSRLMELSFAAVESTFDYFRATRRYLERHGKPMAFYSDRLSVFHVQARVFALDGGWRHALLDPEWITWGLPHVHETAHQAEGCQEALEVAGQPLRDLHALLDDREHLALLRHERRL